MPTVIFVHGSLDRGVSFARTIRRLTPEATKAVEPNVAISTLAYDRRGYMGARDQGVAKDFSTHVADLLKLRGDIDGPVVAVGHSVGGDVVLGAALLDPKAFGAIGVFEPPLPWLGLRPHNFRPLDQDPGIEAELFFRRMVNDAAWDRLSGRGREERRADGPALIADLEAIRGPALFDVTALRVPCVFGRSDVPGHHYDAVGWCVEHVEGSVLFEIKNGSHGAHLAQPDAFGEFVRCAIKLASTNPIVS